jgi:hypothetical protein
MATVITPLACKIEPSLSLLNDINANWSILKLGISILLLELYVIRLDNLLLLLSVCKYTIDEWP